MQQLSGLVHKKHRRGKKRRDKLRLVARVCFYVLLLGGAAALSAGIIHVVERPVAPFESMADGRPKSAGDTDPLAPVEQQEPSVRGAVGQELAADQASGS